MPISSNKDVTNRSEISCIDLIDSSLLNDHHRSASLMLYHEAIRGNSALLMYGDPVWEAVLTEVIPEDGEVNSVVPLIQQTPGSTDIQTLLLVQSEGSQHVLSFVPVPDTLPPSAHADSFDLQLVVDLCHCYLWCESAQIQYRDGDEPGCYDFGKRSKRKKFRRDQYEEEDGSGYGGPIHTREVTIISFGGYGDDNWMFLDGGQMNNGGGGSSGYGGFNATLIDLWSEHYNCLSSSPELAQAVCEKQCLYQGALQIINYVLDLVLDFMCIDLQGPYLNEENFNDQYAYELESFPYLQLYERLGFDHTQNDFLFCMEFGPDAVEAALEMTGNDPLINPCQPESNPVEMVRDAIMAACVNEGELTLEGLLSNLPSAAAEAFIIREYVDSRIQLDPQNENIYISFENGYSMLNCIEPTLSPEGAIDFFERIEENPNYLIENCFPSPEFSFEFWSELASFVPSNEVINKIHNDGFSIQYLQDAKGPRVNLDFYFISISQMPVLNGNVMTNTDLIYYFRQNINDFTEDNGIASCSFSPIQEDEILWESNNPIGANIFIDIVADDGNVVCSDYQPCCWIFTTIDENINWGESGSHPVSGNRQFGIAENGGNKYFYIKGVDRSTTWLDALVSSFQYGTGDVLWTNTIDKFNQFIISNGGIGTIGVPTKVRPNWDAVKNTLLTHPPLNTIPCE